MKEIKLSNGKFALVDDEDFERVSKIHWWATPGHKTDYAGSQHFKKMHQYIMKYPGKEIDHIDGNGLNNQKSNLRICNKSQNMANRTKKRTTLSAYKGITFDKSKNKWMAQIEINGKNKHLGRYSTEIEAAKAYDNAAKKYFGEFARVNF